MFVIRNVIFGMSSVPSLSLSLDGCRLFGPGLEWGMDKQERIQNDCDGEGGLLSSCKTKQNCLGQKFYDSTYRRDLEREKVESLPLACGKGNEKVMFN